MNTPVFYTIFYRPYDGAPGSQELLGNVRRGYLGTFMRAKGKQAATEKGLPVCVRYKIGKKYFEWEKRSGKLLLEFADREDYGYSFTTWDPKGKVVSRARYNFQHIWLQTAYYRDERAPRALLLPQENGDGILMLEQIGEDGPYKKTLLQPCALNGSAAQQTLINTMVGEPQVIAETGRGSFCYCTPQEAASRAAILSDLRSGSLSSQPDWPQEQEQTAFFQYIDNTGAQPETPVREEPKDETVPLEPASAVLNVLCAEEDIPFAAEEENGPEEVLKEYSGDYAVDRELFVLDDSTADGRVPGKYAVAMKGLEGLVYAPQLIRVDQEAVDQAMKELGEKSGQESFEGQKEPAPFVPYLMTREEYEPASPPEQETKLEPLRFLDDLITQSVLPESVHGDTADFPCDVEKAPDVSALEQFSACEQAALEEPVWEEPAAPAEPESLAVTLVPLKDDAGDEPDVSYEEEFTACGQSFLEEPAGDILVNQTQEAVSVQCIPELEDFLVQAKEQPEPQNEEKAKTEDIPPDLELLLPAKRIVISAEESYFYFGKVINGLREGCGRTQLPNGHTAYEGGYQGDKRDGFGVYYYKSGKLCYAGDWKQNRRDGVGVSYSSRDGSIFVGRWKDNIPTGTGAAFDAEGNLLYTGMWKGGLRHGHGTEYQNGVVVYTGEWVNDRYNGYGVLTLSGGTTVSGEFCEGQLPPLQ